MAFIRRDFAGGAVSTTIVGSITPLSTSWLIADATGWPVGTNGPFYATLNRLGPGPTEKVLVQQISGSTVTLAGTGSRGVDGTTAQAWAAPTSFEHTIGAVDADEANLAVSQTLGQITTKGDFLTGKSTGRLQRTPIGSDDTLCIADASQAGGIKFGALPDGAVASATQIADGIITRAKLAPGFYGSYARLSLVGQTPAVSASTLTTFGFQTTDYDDDGLFTDSQTFTVPVGGAGVWLFDAALPWPADGAVPIASTRRYMALEANSTIIDEDSVSSIPVAGVGTTTTVGATYRLADGDTVKVLARQDSSGTLTFSGNAAGHFAATFLRPT